jgi:hypothetical protein
VSHVHYLTLVTRPLYQKFQPLPRLDLQARIFRCSDKIYVIAAARDRK